MGTSAYFISAMGIPFSGRFSRSAGIYSAIGKQLNSVNLKPVQKIVFKFDPFQQNVTTVRDCLFMFSSEKISNTNLRCLIKTDIVDNAEPSISVTLGEGKNFVFKTSNLNSLEVLQEFNKIVLPLVPKEEEVSGKIAGKLAGKSKAVSSAGKQKQKKNKNGFRKKVSRKGSRINEDDREHVLSGSCF